MCVVAFCGSISRDLAFNNVRHLHPYLLVAYFTLAPGEECIWVCLSVRLYGRVTQKLLL